MMTSMFSSFDPSTNINLPLNWMSMMIGIFIIPKSFWFTPSRKLLIWTKLCKFMHKELKIINQSKGTTLIFITMFLIIMFNNSFGLFPYIFTSTSHLVMTLALALPMWVGFMMYGWMNNTMKMLAHTVPNGTPPILMPFMVCIESISNIIRPGTLAIRLSANMISGHLLLTLLGNTGSLMNNYTLNLLIIIQLLLLILESAVALIQSYVFAVLTTLYSSEAM
uniref:ATP synthase subunit a n=1 Tax=Endelus continentalis TaxID=2984121 RepID=A0A977TQ00_9COLE|nr:ATP synthase F0 subunit 6 [Endelus continentalis]UXX50475.1 ATP synthase F0 subunit 6 [Endelus continentalis]